MASAAYWIGTTYWRWPRWAKIVAPLLVLMSTVAAVDAVIPDDPIPSASQAPQGTFAQCKDGTFSDNTDFDKTCSSHDGVLQWLAPYVVCRDGTVLSLNKDASCGGKRGGVDRLAAKEDADQLIAAAKATTTVAKPTSTTAATTIPPATTTAPTTTAAATTTRITSAPPTNVSPTAAPPATARPPATTAAAAPTIGPQPLTAGPSASCNATVSNPSPTRNTTVTVRIESDQPNAPAAATARYKTTTTTNTATSNASGTAAIAFRISSATPGYTVRVDITIGAARCTTSFTPI